MAHNLQELIARFGVLAAKPVQNIRCDHGGEFKSQGLLAWHKKKRIGNLSDKHKSQSRNFAKVPRNGVLCLYTKPVVTGDAERQVPHRSN